MNSSKTKLSTRKKGQPPPNSSDLKLPKIAKTEMPKDFKIRTQPLYSLPEEVLKLPDPNKKKKTRVIKEASVKKSNVMHSYTAMRKAREEFRVKLMSLICQENEGDDQEIPSGEEKNMMRYYYYLNYGVDTVHVAPLDNKMILKVHNLIPVKLKKWRDILLTCTDDMREDFMMSMKKAIVDFVLKDPNTEEAVNEEETPLKAELAKKDDAWRYRYIVAKKFLGKNLHSANPCIAQVLQIWCKQFLDLRLISAKDLTLSGEAYELQDFSFVCKRHIDTAVAVLLSQWVPALKAVFFQGNKKKQIPDPKQTTKMKHFYNCLACMMTYNLQTLCLNSMADYTKYILDVGPGGFDVFVERGLIGMKMPSARDCPMGASSASTLALKVTGRRRHGPGSQAQCRQTLRVPQLVDPRGS